VDLYRRKITMCKFARAICDLSLCLGLFGLLLLPAGAQTPNVSVSPQAKIRPFIVGGTPANIADFPWQVALVFASAPEPTRDQFCGGSLIGQYWVLTAAHCFYDNGQVIPNLAQFTDVISGTATYSQGGVRSHVTDVYINPAYDDQTHDNDVALIKLATPVQPSRFARLNTDASITGDVTVTGWGATAEGGAGSPVLLEATIPLVDNATCNAPSSYNGQITANMLCAGRSQGGVDSCQGDSGGPLVKEGTAVQVGVVSWGFGCARRLKYGVYARVSPFTTWIYSIAGPPTWPAYTEYCRFVGGNPAFLSCALSNGTTFGQYDVNSATSLDQGYGNLPRFMADVNGDGIPDYCRFVGGNPAFLSCALSNESTFGQYDVNSATSLDQGYDNLPRFMADVNGDGKADYCRFVGNPAFLSCALSNGTTFGQYDVNSAPSLDQGYGNLPRFMADVNGDGKADYCRFVGGNPAFLSCALSNGTTFGQYDVNSAPSLDQGYDNLPRFGAAIKPPD
jgi:hypothetical protein